MQGFKRQFRLTSPGKRSFSEDLVALGPTRVRRTTAGGGLQKFENPWAMKELIEANHFLKRPWGFSEMIETKPIAGGSQAQRSARQSQSHYRLNLIESDGNRQQNIPRRVSTLISIY